MPDDTDVYPALVLNPEAIGDPNQTPIVQLSPAMARLMRDGVHASSLPDTGDVGGTCPSCKRDSPPSAQDLAEHLAREDGELFAALSYERRDQYERMAKAAIARIG
jgi:hypothetical protein